jgi:ligand-binding sensor domain-containing protein
MRSSRQIVWLLCVWCLLPCAAAGQTISPERVLGRYQQFVWQDQQGLPQNGISAIVQTPDGYLWLATAEGDRVMATEIRLLIADDHPIVRQGLRQIIETDSALRIVASASSFIAGLPFYCSALR